MTQPEPATYAAAGVSIDAGDEAVERIKPHVMSTHRPEVIGGIGGFGGMFDVSALGMTNPVLVGATDGVGTKAEVARELDRLDTIGIDLVAMCVDDLVCQGARPLFFLDYISFGRLDPARAEALVAGVAEGCRQAGCALIGGEMAEHRGVVADDAFDPVGFAVGAVERDRILTGAHVAAGDVVIGLPSPGLRSNGYTLARRVLLEMAGLPLDGPAWDGAPHTLGDELVLPSVIYTPAVIRLLDTVDVRAIAHVTGGGIVANLPRVLHPGVDAVIERSSWEVPRIFGEIERLGSVEPDEMAKVFNLGVGMIVVVPEADASTALATLEADGHRARAIGQVVHGTGQATLV
ncbi:MAG: phosphoribosylformylglycinamidine cyclo-ligase [Actinomycetia bacterium]|nr:phosphoribosylformylglycinamidine cyclo-ligase [Actinomycetes bacterium]MCP3910575.1 phosphoribosylformylglycinamidine cyclo-ligase [Actinomycetes bacterium]MCP4086067.1 phosphoribosylformylglycinamidine cyclo-ligase [Actinomycetes bacterium]